MPLFEITKPITATFVVECPSEKEAINWADRIVADVTDENGNPVQSKEIILFEADVKVSEIEIEKLKDLKDEDLAETGAETPKPLSKSEYVEVLAA